MDLRELITGEEIIHLPVVWWHTLWPLARASMSILFTVKFHWCTRLTLWIVWFNFSWSWRNLTHSEEKSLQTMTKLNSMTNILSRHDTASTNPSRGVRLLLDTPLPWGGRVFPMIYDCYKFTTKCTNKEE